MKKTIYVVSFDGDDKIHYCPTQKLLCDVLNTKLNTTRYCRENIVHLVYRSNSKNRIGVNIERVNGDVFYSKYIDAYMNTVKKDMKRYNEYHTDHIKRLKNKYVLAIENAVIDAKNAGESEDYIDRQVYLSHPIINVPPVTQPQSVC